MFGLERPTFGFIFSPIGCKKITKIGNFVQHFTPVGYFDDNFNNFGDTKSRFMEFSLVLFKMCSGIVVFELITHTFGSFFSSTVRI